MSKRKFPEPPPLPPLPAEAPAPPEAPKPKLRNLLLRFSSSLTSISSNGASSDSTASLADALDWSSANCTRTSLFCDSAVSSSACRSSASGFTFCKHTQYKIKSRQIFNHHPSINKKWMRQVVWFSWARSGSRGPSYVLWKKNTPQKIDRKLCDCEEISPRA